MSILFNSKIERFQDSKGRFVSKKRGLGSKYGREQYYEYNYNYMESKDVENDKYKKIKIIEHKEIGTVDTLLLLYGKGGNINSYKKAVLKVKQYYSKFNETAQFIVTGFRKSKRFTSTSWSRFLDEFFEDWRKLLLEQINKMGSSGVTIKSVYISLKKFI